MRGNSTEETRWPGRRGLHISPVEWWPRDGDSIPSPGPSLGPCRCVAAAQGGLRPWSRPSGSSYSGQRLAPEGECPDHRSLQGSRSPRGIAPGAASQDRHPGKRRCPCGSCASPECQSHVQVWRTGLCEQLAAGSWPPGLGIREALPSLHVVRRRQASNSGEVHPRNPVPFLCKKPTVSQGSEPLSGPAAGGCPGVAHGILPVAVHSVPGPWDSRLERRSSACLLPTIRPAPSSWARQVLGPLRLSFLIWEWSPGTVTSGSSLPWPVGASLRARGDCKVPLRDKGCFLLGSARAAARHETASQHSEEHSGFG